MANYIKQLQNENIHLKASLEKAIDELTEMQAYYLSSKFQGAENDYAHVSTDIQPRLMQVKCNLVTELNMVS